ncbi:YihY/virulence factor BrkB family protein [Mycobacterium ulcerans]|uniref:Conserved membrane protein n=2 Tax=Mycobacterium ulcerans TaxID=1809 RepID=A0PT62_MYCUA|nr:YihY/virulence factor BrkB family protein [Mycobacterium ulcerans]ABL05531.1 conserved membrane protein [Mycobacterium ulcerans Agy99]MEB3905509.1 YihY/virulence factor BrkB family protein [Mycobacterium ulcerans]MEB3909701.1 YihY/virulence factor BrkB family protein [Mycobacterium ulcerans]MEB3919919.1 YihY/virulence factor BrkB family protein [Mycobacterium ulcerans]MEB3924010.1 YihY/virulence factor BrkB family protein [Mycobacterium ulcerans]
MSEQVPRPSRHHIWRISLRTLSKSWDDSIFSESAQAGFWSALSLPPLLLGMLGSLAYVAPLFGQDTLPAIEKTIISMTHRFFSPSVVDEIIEPTIRDITANARGEVVSVGFLISLWAGSSAISSYVDAIVEAHDQTPLRHPVRQRFFALFLYVVGLLFIVISAPVAVMGPRKVSEHIPDSMSNLMHYGYYPALIAVLTVGVIILYRVSLPVPLPTHRLILGAVLAMAVFLIATLGLRFYLGWITHTGYTYGALSTPIAFLLFAFFGGFAVMIGAELNAAIQEEWPAPATHAHRLRNWLRARTAAATGSADSESPQSNTAVDPPS